MAEGIFKHQVLQRKLGDKYYSDSAGTGAYHIGDQPDPRTLQTLKTHQIAFNHEARQLNAMDADEFDYILAMDNQNMKDIKKVIDKNHRGLFMMRDFDIKAKGADVPDPYFGGQDGFESVYEMLNRSISSFLDYIETIDEN